MLKKAHLSHHDERDLNRPFTNWASNPFPMISSDLPKINRKLLNEIKWKKWPTTLIGEKGNIKPH